MVKHKKRDILLANDFRNLSSQTGHRARSTQNTPIMTRGTRKHGIKRYPETRNPARFGGLTGCALKAGDAGDSAEDFEESRGRGPRTANSGTWKDDRIVDSPHGGGVSKSCISGEGFSGKMTELAGLSPSESRHKKTLEAGAGRVERVYSQEYFAKVSRRAWSATSSVTEP